MMSRVEKVAIAIFIAFACPVSLFVLFWWSTSALAMSGALGIQQDTIIYASLLGLGSGILLNILFMKDLQKQFYDISFKFLIPLYFFWSAVALAFFMGMPFGNLLLGSLAGLYYGRRLYFKESIERDFRKNARTISVFTATITGVESLFIGLLGLHEPFVVEFIQSRSGIGPQDLFGPLGIGLVIGVVIIVMLFQYICTQITFRTALKIGKR